MADTLLRGRLKALAGYCCEIIPLGFQLLAEHKDQLPVECVADIRKAMTILRRIHEDCHNHHSLGVRNGNANDPITQQRPAEGGRRA